MSTRLLPDSEPTQFRSETDPELLQRRIHRLEGELEDARAALREEREKTSAIVRAHAALQRALHPFYDGLRMVYGHLDTSAGPGTASDGGSSSPSGPLDGNRYQPWKDKFRGQTAEAIDILVKYEAGLSRKQLASFLRVEPGSGTMSQVIFKLNKAELIVKDGNLIRLKRI
jgi:hypothetical protein